MKFKKIKQIKDTMTITDSRDNTRMLEHLGWGRVLTKEEKREVMEYICNKYGLDINKMWPEEK